MNKYKANHYMDLAMLPWWPMGE